jgi:hypothetical protein
MPFQIIKNFFSHRDEVLQDLQKTGFWPTTLVSDSSPELPLHWHDVEFHGYVIEGETYLIDESGSRIPFERGDKLILPARTLHAEGVVADRIVYIVAMPEPSNLAPLLQLRDPSELPS